MNIKDFKKILADFENDNIEFRMDVQRQDEKEEKFRTPKTIVAFSNTIGGKIIFGVREENSQRKVVGLPSPQTTESNIVTQIRAKCPSGINFSFEFFKYKKKNILIVHCPRGSKPPYKFLDVVLLRRGSNNVEATEDEIADLYRSRESKGIDSHPIQGALVSDLNIDRVVDYFEGLKIIGEEKSEDDDYRIMNNIGLLKLVGDKYVPTISGILLFGKNPQIFFPNAIIKADVKFAEDDNWAEIVEIRGNIIEQIEECEKFFLRNIPKTAKIIGFKRIEDYQIPISVFREAVVNAIVHRNYLDGSGCIHVHIKKDEVEIISPGGLLPPLTIDAILKGYFEPRTRNPIIAQEVLRNGFMERRGNGLYLINKELKKLNLLRPKFVDRTDCFIVTIYLPSKGENKDQLIIPDKIWGDLKLDKSIKKILQIIEKKDNAMMKDFEEATNKTRGTLIKRLNYLLDEKIIERFPPKPHKSPKIYYTIHSRFKQVEETQKKYNNESNNDIGGQGSLFSS